MLQRSIQSVLELTSNGCYSVGSGVSWSCLLQRSIHSVLGVTWNGCYNVTLEKDVVADCHSWKTILWRLWSYCACHAKRGWVTFAPTLGSHSPLPPPWVGASATPSEWLMPSIQPSQNEEEPFWAIPKHMEINRWFSFLWRQNTYKVKPHS